MLKRHSRRVWLTGVAVFLAALAVRGALLTVPPEFDELYHLLAARGWLETGRFAILDGEYTRGAPFTMLVVWLFQLTGSDSLESGRLVSLSAGVALPVILFLFVRSFAGWLAALVAAGLAVLWPQGILEAQLLRFYSLHVLFFFCGAVSIFGAAMTRGRMRIVLGLLAAALLYTATRLQITTLVGVAGILVWMTGYLILTANASDRQRACMMIAAAVLAAGGLAISTATGALQDIWALFRYTPENAVALRDYVGFYHNSMQRNYQTFWPLFPVAILIAHTANARLTWFCLAIFAAALSVHSFGAMKAERYISYAVPFFFIIWGLAISVLVPRLWAFARSFAASPALTTILVAACVAFALFSNGFFISSAKLALGAGQVSKGDWSETSRVLGDWSDAPLIATHRELHMVAYHGDYDVDLRGSAGWRVEFDENAAFGVDPRTGRHAVRFPDGWQQLLACQRAGVLVTAAVWWNSANGKRFRDFARAEGLTLDLRQGTSVYAVRWTDPVGRQGSCGGVPAFRGAG